MAKLTKSIVIQAPCEKIFAYMNDPMNLPDIWPSMKEVKDVQSLSNGGLRFNYVYNLAGFRLEGTSEDVEFVLNERTVSKSTGGIDAVATFTYANEGSGVKVTLINEYIIPMPVIGKLAESVIVKMNEQEAVTLLDNLKARMEA